MTWYGFSPNVLVDCISIHNNKKLMTHIFCFLDK